MIETRSDWERVQLACSRVVETFNAYTFNHGPLADACDRDRTADPEKGTPVVFSDEAYR